MDLKVCSRCGRPVDSYRVCKSCKRETKERRAKASIAEYGPVKCLDIPCTGTKVCSKCGVEQHVLAFSWTGSALRGECRDCTRSDNRKKPFTGHIDGY